MWMQWLITGGIVAACLAYAIKSLAPKLSQAKGGCGGCGGCDSAATPCTTAKADFQPVEFHPRRIE
jgi:hypothetical protein